MLISENVCNSFNKTSEYPASERLFFVSCFFQGLSHICFYLELSIAENPTITVKHTYLNQKSNWLNILKAEGADRNSMMLPKQTRYLSYLNQSEMQFSSAVNKPTVCKKIRFVKTLKDVLTIKHVHKSFPCCTNSIKKSETFDLQINLFFIRLYFSFLLTLFDFWTLPVPLQ